MKAAAILGNKSGDLYAGFSQQQLAFPIVLSYFHDVYSSLRASDRKTDAAFFITFISYRQDKK
jgi:hypothetical protein